MEGSCHITGSAACESGHKWVEGSYKVRSDGTRICLVCIEEKRLNGMPGRALLRRFRLLSPTGGRGIRCRECDRIRQFAYRLKVKYGLTVEQFEAMLEAQEYRCGLCGDDLDMDKHNGVCVDHDHACCPGEKTCGRCLREILCGDCNQGLGRFKDDIAILQSAIAYLRQYQ